MTKATILIADDHELMRRGLVSIITRSHPEWKVVAEVANGADAIKEGQFLKPDVAILDLSMPEKTGFEAAQTLRQSVPGIRIMILTIFASAPVLRQLKMAGVNAYLSKSEAPRMLVTAVERVLAGEPFFASPHASRAARDLEPYEYTPAQFLLTSRELEVMRLLALGKSNKEIAFELGMSVRTAESHHANLLEKLGMGSVGEIVRTAIRDKVI